MPSEFDPRGSQVCKNAIDDDRRNWKHPNNEFPPPSPDRVHGSLFGSIRSLWFGSNIW